jgi:glycine hydroxymethyltransferase
MVPFDRQGPVITSGIRIGTPIVTTRGMREKEMILIASLVAEVLESHPDPAVQKRVAQQAAELCQEFPFYWDRLAKE